MGSDALILAIDQGTTNTKAILVDRRGAIVSQASRAMAIEYPQPGWVQQDASAIWQAVRECVDECLAAAGSPALAAIGISNQRETGVAWERASGAPIGPAVTWQCRRSAELCERLRAEGRAPEITARTGLPVDPMFTAGKLRWLLDAAPDGQARAAAGELCVGTVDSWLLWNLTGGAAHGTDVSNASRTQLMDIGAGAWDAGLCEAFGVPLAALPRDPALARRLRRVRGHRGAAGRCAHRRAGRRFARGALRPGRLRARLREGHLRHGQLADDAHADAAWRPRAASPRPSPGASIRSSTRSRATST